jgi:hypothetical protein
MRGESYVPELCGIVRIKTSVDVGLWNRLSKRNPPILDVLVIRMKHHTKTRSLQGISSISSGAVEKHQIAGAC